MLWAPRRPSLPPWKAGRGEGNGAATRTPALAPPQGPALLSEDPTCRHAGPRAGDRAGDRRQHQWRHEAHSRTPAHPRPRARTPAHPRPQVASACGQGWDIPEGLLQGPHWVSGSQDLRTHLPCFQEQSRPVRLVKTLSSAGRSPGGRASRDSPRTRLDRAAGGIHPWTGRLQSHAGEHLCGCSFRRQESR